MSATPDGGAAFPRTGIPGEYGMVDPGDKGMSLRDWFAGQALNGLVSQPDDRSCPRDRVNAAEQEEWIQSIRAHDAKWCYAMADAMIKAGTL